MIRAYWLFFCLALAVVPAGPTVAQSGSDEPEAAGAAEGEEVEFLSLAAVLIGDGNYRRARNILARVDLEAEDADLARYHTLAGLVALNLDELALAAAEFEQAIEAGQTEPVVWLYLAQARFGQQQYQQTLAALDQAGPEATRLPSVFLMRAQAHWLLEQYRQAWQVLGQGRALFPDRAGDFGRRQVFLLVDQNLYQEAADQGLQFLESGEASIEDAVAIGNALRVAGQYREAAIILEKARLRAPDNVMLGKVLSHVYLDQQRVLAAADIMRSTAYHDPELTSDAAELYRRAGWLVQALSLNSRVIDQPRKFRQRLAIFIEMNRFEQASSMEQDLARVGLIQDEDIRYALAYALFKTGDFERSEQHLAQLKRADLFRKAIELRGVMERCAERPWACG
ncbi:MAG: hypothetical protein RQ741_04890 [Wenzhouxiangellaceae bacterium]|nr:hypothetical protein [Wenzhouxiangellaceae bacterium]